MATLWRMTLMGSIAIGWVLLARLVLRRGPKVYSYALWAVVLLRLLCPVSPEAPVSLMTQPEGTVLELPLTEQERNAAEEITVSEGSPAPEVSVDPVPALWAVGAAVMAVSGLLRLLLLKRRLREAVLERENIYLCDWVASPFVLGLFRPKIYLPATLEEKEYIILHEQYHIRRLDHLLKILGYVALCIHWFNPLVWVAYGLACRDMEMSCDEAVLKQLGPQVRSDYSQSLLGLAVNTGSAVTLAFGEGDTKMRIKNVLNWKQPKWWSKVLCAVVCLAVLAGCAVDPTAGEIVRYEKDGVAMQLEVPDGWEYQLIDSWQYTDKWGITLKPKELDWEDAEVFLVHWPNGFVANRTFERTDYVLEDGRNVRVGSNYGIQLWDYIYFMDEEKSFVLHAWDTNDWWDEYGEECIDIIHSIEFEY